MKVVILLLLALVSISLAQLTSTQISDILRVHNDARASASPVPQTPLQPLRWSTTIAADAQNWVRQCRQNYSPKWYSTLYGENPVIMNRLDVPTAFNFWFQQGANYNFADKSCSRGTCMNYQQIVAAKATEIGCGVYNCGFGVFFVCNYKTFAQYSNVLPYIPAGPVAPTSAPTLAPTIAPPTQAPTRAPTSAPATPAPTSKPSTTTGSPTPPPTAKPTPPPTTRPTPPPTARPTPPPTARPTPPPTAKPTSPPTAKPTSKPGAYDSIDYRGTKAVLAVHDQKQCGSCWAFSTVTIIEGALGLRGLTLPLLSDQNVLDCSGGGSCNGGWPTTALKGMVSKGGINSNSEYPYKAAQGACAYNAATSLGAITKYGQTKGDFNSIYNALVQYGPVGIAVWVDTNVWYSYRSGVISGSFTNVNHAVTVVGYDATKDAWIVKNSWGASWGMSGYLYLSASSPAGANLHGAFWAQ